MVMVKELGLLECVASNGKMIPTFGHVSCFHLEGQFMLGLLYIVTHKEDRQTYNVTMRRVQETIVAVEKQ